MSSIISKPEAYPLRERFSRETTNFTQKLISLFEFLTKVNYFDFAFKLDSQLPGVKPSAIFQKRP